MTSLVEKTDAFVADLLEKKLPKTCIYHNYVHAKRVYKSTKEIIEKSDLSQEEKEDILIAALLHDTGYIHGRDEHEGNSVKIAEDFLAKEAHPKDRITRIGQAIMATKMDNTPVTDLDKILRDADASHFAKSYFEEASEYLRQELRIQGIAEHSLEAWRKCNIEMFTTAHHYYTPYAIEYWKPKKDANLMKMLKEQKKLKKAKKKEKLKAKLKDESPEKGVQSMFRITLRNHIKLSDIADTKANILLSVNAIILSMALSNLIPKLDNPSNSYLIVPTVVFIVFSIISMILSVLATRPNVTMGKFTREDVEQKKVNLLFFGNFHKMSLTDFEWAINEMMQDKDYIYSALTKDLYFLGIVLDRKYRILRITYTVFIIGIIASVIAFAIFFKMQEAPIVLT
ncbi:Pycsar system effector family protein [uncultured Dokdonia sp.]|uniref:Pycsar system effector family protein n=1 Tax=uncultured Dokdonia sp. TaxID=575653 RepID=UPI0026123DC2|nr:Pycsar system effector family protein [uncultured Dokdonia sp.]